MILKAQKILSQINPPSDSSTFEDILLLAQNRNDDNITICLLSTFHFVEKAIKKIVQEEIPGDILLAGVWRGGLAAYIQALLIDHDAASRTLYLADIFKGPINITDQHRRDKETLQYTSSLNIPQGDPEEIKKTFQRLGLPLDNVVFLEGDIKSTTSSFSNKLAVLLLDMDFYTSTIDCLNNTYSNVSENGIIYVDDYYIPMFECKEAVDNFIEENRLNAEITKVNKIAISWIKKSSASAN